MKRQYLFLILFSVLLVSCDLEEIPQSTTSKSAVFGSESGLQLYSNDFYNMLPGLVTSGDEMSDYLAIKAVPNFEVKTREDGRLMVKRLR